jgi:hypothetical protein
MPFLHQTKTADTHFPESEAAAAEATLLKKEKQTNKQTTCVGVYLPSTRSTTQTHYSQNLEKKQHTHKHMHTYIPTCDDDLFFFFFFFSFMMINMKQISKTWRKFLSPFSSPACNPVTPAPSLSFRRKRSFKSPARRFHQNRLPFSQILTDFSHFFAKRKKRIRSMREDRHIFYF